MSAAKFEELLQMVGPKIQKYDTVFRTLILARTKLEPTIRHLARGDNSRFQTFAAFWMLYAFFWVIPRRPKFICRSFGTLSVPSPKSGSCAYLPMKMGLSVPKRRHINFRRRGTTQKKAHNRGDYITSLQYAFRIPPVHGRIQSPLTCITV